MKPENFQDDMSLFAWDPDFTKVTPEERRRIEEAENSGFIPEDEIDWDHLEKYKE